MSAPIYTPFFIHPNQKKRIPRKRNVTAMPAEESFGASGAPPSAYDTRSRRQAAGWPADAIPMSSSSSTAAYHPHHNHQTSVKRSRTGSSIEEEETQRQPQSATTPNAARKSPKTDDDSSSAPHDVAAEVEVNVEDDVGDIDAPSRPENATTASGTTQFAGVGAEPSASGHGHHHQHYSQQSSHRPAVHLGHGHHHRQQQPGHRPTAGGGGPSVAAVVVPTNKFDPDACSDVAELRHRLYAAYDRIEQLGRANMCINRLKHDNTVMKSELNKCTYRISQLESVVLERNLRLKQLLSENVLMSARMKRIQSEFGVDAVKEIFSRDRE